MKPRFKQRTGDMRAKVKHCSKRNIHDTPKTKQCSYQDHQSQRANYMDLITHTHAPLSLKA